MTTPLTPPPVEITVRQHVTRPYKVKQRREARRFKQAHGITAVVAPTVYHWNRGFCASLSGVELASEQQRHDRRVSARVCIPAGSTQRCVRFSPFEPEYDTVTTTLTVPAFPRTGKHSGKRSVTSPRTNLNKVRRMATLIDRMTTQQRALPVASEHTQLSSPFLI